MQSNGLLFILNATLKTIFFSILNVILSHERGQELGLLNQLISLTNLITSMFLSKLFHHSSILQFALYKIIIHRFNILYKNMNYKSSYLQKQSIGRGHYGTVYLVYDRKTSHPYVAKKIDLEAMSALEQQAALKQVKIHKQLKHKNILSFKEYFMEDSVLIMIMEYCEFGDLSVYIKQRKQQGQFFDEALIINLFVQMLFGLNYLHQNKILHRDIKTQNIFIDSEGIIKLADFGISKILEKTQNLASTVVGTPYYLSPEACSNSGYSFKSDIWSLGCVLYQLCSLQHPFKGDNILILAKRITSQQPDSIPNVFSNQLQQLLKSMLRKSPEQRPTIKQILQKKYISDYLIQYKIQNPLSQKQLAYQKPNKQYPIFETSEDLQNQFIDDHYKKKQIQNIKNSTPNKNKQSLNKIQEVAISPNKSRTDKLRQKCIQKMGDELFEQMYSFMKSAQRKNLIQSKVQEQLKKRYSKKEFQMSMDIAQLLYLEEAENK